MSAATLVELIADQLRPEYADRAKWLSERAVDLRSPDDLDKERAVDALRGVIHGMGGLLDLSVDPSRRRRLDQLIDELWLLITPSP